MQGQRAEARESAYTSVACLFVCLFAFSCQFVPLFSFAAEPVSDGSRFTSDAFEPDAAGSIDDLLKHIDALWRGQTSHALMTMTVKTARYQRTMSLEAWSMGAERSLVVIRQPLKDRGVATLKVEANIWNYLPRIDRVTKVPSSMMSGTWMGSHFTNDDLVKESTFSDDYVAQRVPQGDDTLIKISATPKMNAHVVWGRVLLWIHLTEFYPKKIEYFDEQDRLVRTLHFDQVTRVGERIIPMRLRLQPSEHPDESTEIVYQSIDFDVPIQERFFSLQNLKNRK